MGGHRGGTVTGRLVIRRALLGDLAAVAPLFDAYRGFYRMPSEPDRVEAFLADRLRNQDSVILLALVDGVPTGFVQLYPIFSSVSIGRAMVLNDLFVTPTGRGAGVGRALLGEAAKVGREAGLRYLELATEVTNETAQRLYESAGWTRDTGFHHYSLSLQ